MSISKQNLLVSLACVVFALSLPETGWAKTSAWEGTITIPTYGWSDDVNFNLPWPGNGRDWYRVTDTCNWAEGANQVRSPGSEDHIGGEGFSYGVCGRGVLLLIAK